MASVTENGNQNIKNDKILYIQPKKEFKVEKGIGEYMFESMKKHKETIVQIDPETNEKQTYASLFSRSVRTAQNLRLKGIKAGEIISICSFNNMNYTSTVLGSFLSGAIIALLDPFSPIGDKIHCFKLTEPKIVFCDEELESEVEEALKEAGLAPKIVVFEKTERNVPYSDYLIECEPEDQFKVHKVEDVLDTVCIHFSSGTTGLPKGVCVTHYGLMHGAIHFKGDYMDVKTTMIVTSPFWISNMNSLVASVLSGDTRIILKKFEDSTIFKHVQDYKISLITITPTSGAAFMKHPEYYKNYDISSLIAVGTGGTPTQPKQFLEYTEMFPHCMIVGGYGMTETGGHILNIALQVPEEIKKCKHSYVGTPIPGYTYKIVNPETEELLGPNEEGELRVKFKGMMKEYYKNPKAFADSFDSEGFLKTGDILYYDDKLRFYYVTRIKDVFKYICWHISPVQIETELIKHPNVRECVVFGTPHETDIEHVTAAVVVDDKSKFDEKELIEFANSRLGDRYHLRGGVYLVDSIPTTSTGKILRKKLAEMVLNLKNKA